MSLRARIILYLVIIHLILGAIAFAALHDKRPWLIAVEALFAVSIGIGVLIVRAFFIPLDLIRTGADLLNEGDLTTRFREVGHPEMDALIRIYNRMSEDLRTERLRQVEQHHLLTRVLDATPAGVLVFDFDGRIAVANPAAARLLGVAPEKIEGHRLEDVGGKLAEEIAMTTAGSGRVFAHEGRRRLRCQKATFLDRGFTRAFVTIEELTEELRQSERAAYDKLVRMMSHEVNNSTGAVASLLESCSNWARKSQASDSGEYASALDAAGARIRHLNSFMNGFADVVRLPPPERRPCDVRRLMDEIVLVLRFEMDRRRIVAEWIETMPAAVVDLDKNQVEQALVNVMLNAMEAIGEDGRIELRLTPAAKQAVRLRVRDTGPGITAKAAAQLFTPFYSSKRNGRGVGLTLISEILTHHRAEFGLANHPEGGAEFWVEF